VKLRVLFLILIAYQLSPYLPLVLVIEPIVLKDNTFAGAFTVFAQKVILFEFMKQYVVRRINDTTLRDYVVEPEL
jgi:hypothetical protein